MALVYDYASDRYVDLDVAKSVVWSEDMDLRMAWNIYYSTGLGENAFRRDAAENGVEAEWCTRCWDQPRLKSTLVPVEKDGEFLACTSCAGRYYKECAGCKVTTAAYYQISKGDTGRNDTKVWCRTCTRDVAMICNTCGNRHYIHDADKHTHGATPTGEGYNPNWGCDCESPAPTFLVPVKGEPVPNDTPVTIATPTGKVSAGAIRKIKTLLRNTGYITAEGLVDQIGNDWTDDKGVTWPKRLSALLYKTNKTKMTQYAIEDIGNYARSEVVSAGEYTVEFTRNLNQSPTAMGHAGSCWWGGYSSSRCALKSNGGFGIRTFGTTRAYTFAGGPKPVTCKCSAKCKSAGTKALKAWKARGGDTEIMTEVPTTTGRAWVLPLRVSGEIGNMLLTPTLDTETPDALIVFNGYGDLKYNAAGVLISEAYGLPYDQITFDCGARMSVNGPTGLLVAPQAVIDQYTYSGWFPHINQHATLLPEYLAEREAAAAQMELEVVGV